MKYGILWILLWCIIGVAMFLGVLIGYIRDKKRKPTWMNMIDTLSLLLLPFIITVTEYRYVVIPLLGFYMVLREVIYPFALYKRKGAWKNPFVFYSFMGFMGFTISTNWKGFVSFPAMFTCIYTGYYILIGIIFWYNRKLARSLI